VIFEVINVVEEEEEADILCIRLSSPFLILRTTVTTIAVLPLNSIHKIDRSFVYLDNFLVMFAV
jgi:hypothetical protein